MLKYSKITVCYNNFALFYEFLSENVLFFKKLLTSSGKDKSTMAPGCITAPLTSWAKVWSFSKSEFRRPNLNVSPSETTLMEALPLAENNLGQRECYVVHCPIHLYLIFEKSSLMNWIFNLQKSISKLIFAGYTGCKNPVWNRLKIQFVELDFSNLIFQKSSTDG